MFQWLKSFFIDRKTTTMHSTELPQAEPLTTPTTWVYVWKMTQNGPGHAAIQVGGQKPKLEETDPGEYLSIHPYGFPSMGPTTVLPLRGHLARTLTEDMELEAESRHKPMFGDTDAIIPFQEQTTPLAPDETIKIEHMDTSAMLREMEQTNRDVSSGRVGYQLFPNINLLKFFKDAPAFIAQDPIDVEMHRRFLTKADQHDIKARNCTTLVSNILNIGGKQIEHSTLPWGITPNGLSHKLGH